MQSKRLFLFLTVLLWAGLVTTGCENKEGLATIENQSSQAPVIPVLIIEVKPVPMRDVILLPGTTEAWQDVQVAADTAGRIEWIGPREGEMVNK
jgi:membrane fusion protein (multidrug efflux system)